MQPPIDWSKHAHHGEHEGLTTVKCRKIQFANSKHKVCVNPYTRNQGYIDQALDISEHPGKYQEVDAKKASRILRSQGMPRAAEQLEERAINIERNRALDEAAKRG